MNTPKAKTTDSSELLARVHLTAADRLRAEAALRRGEALADLLLAAAGTVNRWMEEHRRHATDPRHLKSAG